MPIIAHRGRRKRDVVCYGGFRHDAPVDHAAVGSRSLPRAVMRRMSCTRLTLYQTCGRSGVKAEPADMALPSGTLAVAGGAETTVSRMRGRALAGEAKK